MILWAIHQSHDGWAANSSKLDWEEGIWSQKAANESLKKESLGLEFADWISRQDRAIESKDGTVLATPGSIRTVGFPPG